MFKELCFDNGNIAAVETEQMAVIIKSFSKKKINLPKISGDLMWIEINTVSGWKLQENILTHHCRLVSPSNVIKAWGEKNKMVELMNKTAEE